MQQAHTRKLLLSSDINTPSAKADGASIMPQIIGRPQSNNEGKHHSTNISVDLSYDMIASNSKIGGAHHFKRNQSGNKVGTLTTSATLNADLTTVPITTSLKTPTADNEAQSRKSTAISSYS